MQKDDKDDEIYEVQWPFNNKRSSSRCQTLKAVDVQHSRVKLPFWFIDTELLTSCCVTDECDAPSGAYSQSVEQVMPARSREQHPTTDCWLETSLTSL